MRNVVGLEEIILHPLEGLEGRLKLIYDQEGGRQLYCDVVRIKLDETLK